MKLLSITLLLGLLTGFIYGQQTYVPDDNFENYLETHDASGGLVSVGDANSMGNGIVNDDYVLTSRISNVTTLNVMDQYIADLTGIEDFTALQVLYCGLNQLTSLDISQNTALNELYCYYNQLTSLDVSHNTALSLLDCGHNQLTSLDISQNITLESLDCNNNQLTSLNILQNTGLQVLSCYYNQISGLDVTQNTNLHELYCYNNQITDLDLTQNTALQSFTCSQNQLTNLDMRNVDITSFTDFGATFNPNLTCVFVDDANYMNTSWPNAIDATATYVETQAQCDALSIDESFKEQIQIYPNPFRDFLNI